MLRIKPWAAGWEANMLLLCCASPRAPYPPTVLFAADIPIVLQRIASRCQSRIGNGSNGHICRILPVMLSQSILDVMMAPQEANSRSRSGWVRCLGRPDTYRLAPFIASLLGRAYETCNQVNTVNSTSVEISRVCLPWGTWLSIFSSNFE